MASARIVALFRSAFGAHAVAGLHVAAADCATSAPAPTIPQYSLVYTDQHPLIAEPGSSGCVQDGTFTASDRRPHAWHFGRINRRPGAV